MSDDNNRLPQPGKPSQAEVEEAREVASHYTHHGLNQCLRIGSIGYVYEPELDLWTHDYTTPEGYFAQHSLDAAEIHSIILAGKYRVTPWEVSS